MPKFRLQNPWFLDSVDISRDNRNSALSGELDDLIPSISCHGASICSRTGVGGYRMVPNSDMRLVEIGNFILEGKMGADIQIENLQSGDLLTFHSSNMGMGFINPVGPVNSYPVHSSRVLDITSDGTIILFNKTNVGYPYEAVP